MGAGALFNNSIQRTAYACIYMYLHLLPLFLETGVKRSLTQYMRHCARQLREDEKTSIANVFIVNLQYMYLVNLQYMYLDFNGAYIMLTVD